MPLKAGKKLGKKLADECTFPIQEKLKARRKELGLTQEKIAKYLGCTPQQVQKYEGGRSRIAVPTLLKICEVLKMHPSRMFSGVFFAENATANSDPKLEKRLVELLRSVDNEVVRERIVALVETLVLTYQEA